MPTSESDGPLRPVSVVVLGLLETVGPQTSYELWRSVEVSVSFFWQVARSQLYAEPQRLERLGLVTSEQEESGRRRRSYAITDEGRGALIAWLRTQPDAAQYYDPAMLRLFFADAAPHLVEPLARRRVEELTMTLQFLEQPGMGGTEPNHLRVLSWGKLTVRADLAFWQSILDDLESDR